MEKYTNSPTINADEFPLRMLADEKNAYSSFSDQFGPQFCVYFRRKGLQAVDAEDLAISCVTSVALAVDKFADEGPGSFSRWAFRIAHNMLVDWLEGRGDTVSVGEIVEGQGASEEKEVSEEEEAGAICDAIREAITELGEPDATIVFMRLLEEPYTFAEIGEKSGLSERATRTRHHRALKKLEPLLLTKQAVTQRLGCSR